MHLRGPRGGWGGGGGGGGGGVWTRSGAGAGSAALKRSRTGPVASVTAARPPRSPPRPPPETRKRRTTSATSIGWRWPRASSPAAAWPAHDWSPTPLTQRRRPLRPTPACRATTPRRPRGATSERYPCPREEEPCSQQGPPGPSWKTRVAEGLTTGRNGRSERGVAVCPRRRRRARGARRGRRRELRRPAGQFGRAAACRAAFLGEASPEGSRGINRSGHIQPPPT